MEEADLGFLIYEPSSAPQHHNKPGQSASSMVAFGFVSSLCTPHGDISHGLTHTVLCPLKGLVIKVWEPLHITVPSLGDPRGHQCVKGSEKSCSQESCFSVVSKLKQVPLLRNSTKLFIYPSQKRECESSRLLISAMFWWTTS